MMITVKNYASDELKITIDSDGDICGEYTSYDREEAAQMAAILNHYATTGEVKLP